MNQVSIPDQDTIAAIATAEGDGGIAVIRISGPKALDTVNLLFRAGGGNEHAPQMESHKLYHGRIIDPESGELVDEVLCVSMRSPNSYTGEDAAEIHSHGGYLVPNKILTLLFSLGIRPANPGEFSLRAFLNGKMDLTQAEAVADIVNAQTQEGLKQAELQLEGHLSAKINDFKETVLDVLAEVEAQVDFPEEDIDPMIKDDLIRRITVLIRNLDYLLATYEEGRIIKYGVKTAILGKPNVGKSSLLNNLLMTDRAIVSPEPGTTRDFIEESIDVRGIPLRLIDTAGIRATSDNIEKTGVQLARKKALEAELVLVVLDGSSELNDDDIEVLNESKDKKALVILNKSDIGTKIRTADLPGFIAEERIIHTSAKIGTGIEELKDKIRELLTGESRPAEAGEIVLTELRHKLAIEKARDSLASFLEVLGRGESPEFLALDLRVALDSLGEITGEVTTEDILGRIFSKFCVGK